MPGQNLCASGLRTVRWSGGQGAGPWAAAVAAPGEVWITLCRASIRGAAAHVGATGKKEQSKKKAGRVACCTPWREWITWRAQRGAGRGDGACRVQGRCAGQSLRGACHGHGWSAHQMPAAGWR